LQQAYEDSLIPRNPAQVVRPVKAPPRKFDVWGEAEVDSFTKAAEGHSFYPLFYLGLMTGLRPGELLALTWADIITDEVLVRQGVTQPKGGHKIGVPKTPNAIRAVPLPSDARDLLFTRTWALSEQRHRVTLREGNARLVFPNEVGNLIAPWNLHKRVWTPLLEDADIEHVRPYVLGHTFASMQIAAGVDAVTLARWMGHSDSGFTLRTYTHFFERREKVKAKTLKELLGRS
jgi:integrase